MSDCELFAHINLYKRVNVSKSMLLILKTERFALFLSESLICSFDHKKTKN